MMIATSLERKKNLKEGKNLYGNREHLVRKGTAFVQVRNGNF